MKEALSSRNVPFVYVDISDGMKALRDFLLVRDHAPSHAPVRESGRVGVPTLVVEDESFIIIKPEDLDAIIEKYELV